MIIVDDPRDVRLFDGLIILNVGGLYGDTSMAKKIGYTPISIFAAGCEAIATAAALTNPATAPFAVGIGTAASAVAGGIELNDEEKNIKDNLDKAMDKAWATIDKKYRLSLHTEKYTDNCLTELKREVMGENTSVEEFVRNTEIKGFEPSIALVIKGILKKHVATLNRDPAIIWNDEYTENAAKDMASILVAAIKSVFEDVDHLRILKAISESEEKIINRVEDKGDQIIEEVQKIKPAIDHIKVQLSSMSKNPLNDKSGTLINNESSDIKGNSNSFSKDINTLYSLIKESLFASEQKDSSSFLSYYDFVKKRFTRKKQGEYVKLVGDYSDEEAYIDPYINLYNWAHSEKRLVLSYLEKWFDPYSYGVMLIYGEPGHGKSTLCDKAVVEFCKGKFLKEAKNVLAVSLNTGDNRRIIKDGMVVIENALAWGNNRQHTFTFEECRGSLLFLDGFDEFIDEAKKANISDIVSFMNLVSGIANEYDLHIVVLSRTTAVKKHLKRLHFRSFQLSPITEEQQKTWIDKHKDYYDYKKTFKTLRKNENMSELLGIPFLFRMIVHSRFNQISSNVVELYDKLIDHLMEKRNIRGDRFDKVVFELRNLAYNIYCYDTDTTTISEYEIDTQWVVAFYIKQVDKSTIGFFHRSFYQYFMAGFIYYGILNLREDNVDSFIGLFAEREFDDTVQQYLSLMVKEGDRERINANLQLMISSLIRTEGYINFEPRYLMGDTEKTKVGRTINIFRNIMHIFETFTSVIQVAFNTGIDTFFRLYPSDHLLIYSDINARANLTNSYLKRADLTESDLSRADMRGAMLQGASLIKATLVDTNMDSADLSGANLTQANLSGSTMNSVNLSQSILIKSDLGRTIMSGSNLDNAVLKKANLVDVDLSYSKMNGADLRHAYLIRVDLSGVDLREALMSFAILKNVDLSGADLTGANMDGISLNNVIFKNTIIDTIYKDYIDPSIENYDTILWV